MRLTLGNSGTNGARLGFYRKTNQQPRASEGVQGHRTRKKQGGGPKRASQARIDSTIPPACDSLDRDGLRGPNRQTTLPSGRGVCLISSSCPGSLTAATGSDLAGRRLQQCALRTVLRAGGSGPAGPPPLVMDVTPRARSGSASCVSSSTTYRPALPAPRGGGRRRETPGGGGRLRGGLAPPLRARSAVPQHGATSTSSRR